jgi:branched-chain amino acid transport system permease protein
LRPLALEKVAKMVRTRVGTRGRWVVLVIAILGSIVLPSMLNGYWGRVAKFIVMWAILAQSFNIITGFVGYPAFGNTVFFGVGAYAMGLAHTSGVPPVIAIPLAGVIAAAYCAIVGVPILRLKGHYFAIATLGLMLFTRETVTNMRDLTKGSSGIILKPIVEGTPAEVFPFYYYLMLAVLAACTTTTWWITRSRFGYGLRSIKADEDAAASFGINTTSYKVIAWAMSAFFTGLAGAIWALWLTFIDPTSAFSMSMAATFSVMALLGGLGTVLGPLLGALIVELSTQVILGAFYDLHLAVTGLLIILIVLLLPNGLVRALRERRFDELLRRVRGWEPRPHDA